jgi:hypothetical protein
MAGSIGNYPSYGYPGYYGQGASSYPGYTANPGTLSSPYGSGQGYDSASFALLPGNMSGSVNDQFYNVVVDPNLDPIQNVPSYTPNAGNPDEFYNTVIGPSVQQSDQIYDSLGGNYNGLNSDDMLSFSSGLDQITGGASETYRNSG